MEEKDIQLKDITDLSETSLFDNNHNLSFIFKKTQRISYAVFILSDLIDNKDPLRISLRSSAANLIKNSLLIAKNSRSERTAAFESLVASLFETSSFCEAAFFSKLLTEMNFQLIKEEIKKLVFFIKENMDKKIVLETSFMEAGSPEGDKDKGQNVLYKGQSKKEDSVLYKKEVKSKRSEIIISLLKGGRELTIRDFHSNIKGCSEKTIQRELLSMVAKGTLKKTGERRWSRYSLLT